MTTLIGTKPEMFRTGLRHMVRWCALNNVDAPAVVTNNGEPPFRVCAYYRSGIINIWINSCAAVGRAGRMWSWPGYSVDRTPYGVLQHELGHHVDRAHGPRGGQFGKPWRVETRERPITGYCENDNEWFAEMFRVYVTNPDLLRILRPKTFQRMKAHWPHHAETRPWETVLEGAERQIAVVKKHFPSAKTLISAPL